MHGCGWTQEVMPRSLCPRLAVGAEPVTAQTTQHLGIVRFSSELRYFVLLLSTASLQTMVQPWKWMQGQGKLLVTGNILPFLSL